VDEALDQPTCDRWREQRVAACDRPDARDELFRRRILQQASASRRLVA